jgi:hypothetical protein
MTPSPIICRHITFDPASLDNASNLTQVHCVGWRDTENLTEPWTALCQQAKAGDSAATNTVSKAMAYIAASCRFTNQAVYVLPLIGHDKTEASPDSLPWLLANTVADAIGGCLMGSWLTKAAHRSLHGPGMRAQSRDAEVDDVYTATLQSPPESASALVLLVDDFITRGSTMNDAARALQAAIPGIGVVGLALGKTYRATYTGHRANDHFDATLSRITSIRPSTPIADETAGDIQLIPAGADEAPAPTTPKLRMELRSQLAAFEACKLSKKAFANELQAIKQEIATLLGPVGLPVGHATKVESCNGKRLARIRPRARFSILDGDSVPAELMSTKPDRSKIETEIRSQPDSPIPGVKLNGWRWDID